MKTISEKSARKWMRKHAREIREYRANPRRRKPGGQWARQYRLCLRVLGDIRFRSFEAPA